MIYENEKSRGICFHPCLCQVPPLHEDCHETKYGSDSFLKF